MLYQDTIHIKVKLRFTAGLGLDLKLGPRTMAWFRLLLVLYS